MFARWVRTALSGRRPFSVESNAGRMTSGRDTLGRRILSLIYPKRSAVITIRKWAEEGNSLRKYELNRVVRELRKYKRYKHALEICEWMTGQQDIKLLPGDYAVHLDLISKVRGLASAEKFFEDLPERMRGQPTCTSLLHSYVQHKLPTKAEALMDKMSECGFLRCPLPYNHMLTMYISNGQLEKIPLMIQELKKNTSPDVVTYNLWLSACANQNDVEGAEKVLLELKKRKLDADWFTYSTLTSIYINATLLGKARDALKEMEQRVSKKNRVAYCSLLTLNANLLDKNGVYKIWKKIKSSFLKMNDAEYMSMISSLVKLGDIEEAENLYSEWESVSGTRDSRIPNLLLAVYIKENTMDKAENFHEQMIQRGIVSSYGTWEILAWGYLNTKKMDKVIDCFKKALSSLKKWEPNNEIIRAVFDKLEMLGDIERAEQFLVILRNAGHTTTQIYNSLLRTYVKAGKMPLIVVERMKKDKVELDDETQRLMKMTSKLCVGEVPNIVS
ncbi:pentatricopeptide repeat (PPR) superfamily protein isoform X2 [Tasmannia lanceolata]|uniref:pentatricopeptide repeat (PPR) superfamily protein isoform X2 n=1 Tax=Tasmannia lanceolata TaxID=3420 RepID=UPI004062C84E